MKQKSVQPGLEMRFRPFDNYHTLQNPPDFSWPWVEDAESYDLIVCRDRELKDIAYSRYGNRVNYYNFPEIFEPGMYYWSVRHHRDGRPSAWEPARRFLLDPAARPFPVPDVEVLLSRIAAGHPRIYTNARELADFRKEMLSPDNTYFPMVMRALSGFMAEPFPEEKDADPLDANPYTMFGLFQHAADTTKAACDRVTFSAFAYLVTEDEAIGRYAVECLLRLAAWDPDGVTTYSLNDQAHRRIAVYSALAYDWISSLLSEEERKRVVSMIRDRTAIICRSDESNINQLDRSPFDSHGGTAIGYVCLIGLALYGDVPEAEEWLRYVLPLYINFFEPFSNEDGGWAQGTYYWSCGFFGKKALEAMLSAGVIDLYQKTWQQNEPLYPLYCWPEGSVGAFGDNSYILPTGKNATQASMLAYRIGTPESKWLRNQLGYMTAYGHTDDPDPGVCCHDRLYPPEEAYLPEETPKEHFFPDIGWVAAHSDLEDPERVSVFFKSSWYGSFNHSHPDQNSFIIQAYGEPLAIDSGYYDLYNYPFDAAYTRKTYAHNAVTYANGQGQPAMDILAKGKILGFAGNSRAVLTAGDAAEAYRGGLDRAVRYLLYLRPDLVVIIDDLAAKEEEETTFEFWLNAQKYLDLDGDGRGCRAVNGRAALDVRVQYPAVQGFRSQDFAGTDGVPHYPVYEGHARWPVQKRVWFQTERVRETRMVTTLDIHSSKTPGREITGEIQGNCQILRLPGGMTLYVNLDGNGFCAAEGVFFRGAAALTGPDLFLLANGTELKTGGRKIVSSDVPVFVILGGRELSVSSLEADASVQIGLEGPSRIFDEKKREILADSRLLGACAEFSDGMLNLWLYNGAHRFALE